MAFQVAIRDKTTSTSVIGVTSAGVITATVKGNMSPPSRSMDYWTVDQFSFAAATDTLLTVTESVNGAATGTFTSRVITAGKTMRITSGLVALENVGSGVAICRVYIGFRLNNLGACTVNSPLILRNGFSVAGAIKSMTTSVMDIPNGGMEIIGDGVKCIGITAICPDWVTSTQVPKITISVLAYEYAT